jgi:dTDP-4-dehydrorhamnose reductase
MKVLILGANGMLGSTVYRFLNRKTDWTVYGTLRSDDLIKEFPTDISGNLISGCDVVDSDNLNQIMTEVNPDVVINCIGVIKQITDANDPEKMRDINTLLPHKLSEISAEIGARLIHISTDCVFSGDKGNYTESDTPDAEDLYGKSKLLGEVSEKHCITLRTSMIGHEMNTKNSLIEWFLSQNDSCKGYTRAIFSGLPTIILAELIVDIIIPMKELHGVYHIASEAISKFDLLKLISDVYGKNIELIPDSELVIDRSLSADKFQQITGYKAPRWPSMIEAMYSNK